MTRRPLFADSLVAGLIVGSLHCTPAPKKASDVTSSTQDTSQPAPSGLGDTSWHLVKFQSSDGTILKPDDKAKYTIAFEPDGRLSARIDCNRGRGTWKSSTASARVGSARTHPHDVPARIAPRSDRQAVALRPLVRDQGGPPVSIADGRRRHLRVRAHQQPTATLMATNDPASGDTVPRSPRWSQTHAE